MVRAGYSYEQVNEISPISKEKYLEIKENL